eukprot:11193084-Lingulodinium_polyedra.AAC.1
MRSRGGTGARLRAPLPAKSGKTGPQRVWGAMPLRARGQGRARPRDVFAIRIKRARATATTTRFS